MKRFLTFVLLLSICIAPQVLAEEPTPPDASGLIDTPPIVSQIKASLNENVHDRGRSIIEAVIARLQEIKAAILGIVDDGGDEEPSE